MHVIIHHDTSASKFFLCSSLMSKFIFIFYICYLCIVYDKFLLYVHDNIENKKIMKISNISKMLRKLKNKYPSAKQEYKIRYA